VLKPKAGVGCKTLKPNPTKVLKHNQTKNKNNLTPTS
jgi:hypothetical protein